MKYESLVVKVIYGSHLYGTNTPESDTDFKSVHIPPADEILLQRVRGSVGCESRPKGEGERNTSADVDTESYSLQRYFELLAEGQTVAIDMLFAPDSSIVETSALWEYIRSNKQRLLTKKSVAFVGYCRSQGNKYCIKGSRVAAARDASTLLTKELETRGYTAKLGELETELRALIGDHTNVLELPVSRDGRTEWFFECCNRKVSFNSTIKHAKEVYTNVFNSYGDRAKKSESNVGVDYKALSHSVRVGQEAIELLETGNVTLPLPNAKYITDIKRGLVPYEQVAKDIEGLLEKVEAAAIVSTLPDSVDTEFIDEIVLEAYCESVLREYM
jgi:hypothetical protein